MKQLKFFYAYRSPYSALAADIVYQASKTEAFKHFDVTPVNFTIDEGFADPTANPDKVAYIVQDVIRLYGERGLRIAIPDPFDIDFTMPTRATQAAIAAGHGLAFIREASLLRWGEGQNLTAPDVLAEAATRAGWDGDAARAALDRRFETEIAADKALCKSHKVFGVPFFIVENKGEDESGSESFWGQDRWGMVLQRLGV